MHSTVKLLLLLLNYCNYCYCYSPLTSFPYPSVLLLPHLTCHFYLNFQVLLLCLLEHHSMINKFSYYPPTHLWLSTDIPGFPMRMELPLQPFQVKVIFTNKLHVLQSQEVRWTSSSSHTTTSRQSLLHPQVKKKKDEQKKPCFFFLWVSIWLHPNSLFPVLYSFIEDLASRSQPFLSTLVLLLNTARKKSHSWIIDTTLNS